MSLDSDVRKCPSLFDLEMSFIFRCSISSQFFHDMLSHVPPTCCHMSTQRAVTCPPLLIRVKLALIYIYIYIYMYIYVYIYLYLYLHTYMYSSQGSDWPPRIRHLYSVYIPFHLFDIFDFLCMGKKTTGRLSSNIL